LITRILLVLTIFLTPLISKSAGLTRNGLFYSIESFVGSGGTSTITFTSPQIQVVTGSLDHTIQLPDATTLKKGWFYEAINAGTGTVTITDSASTTVATLEANDNVVVYANDITSATAWSVKPSIFQLSSLLTTKGDLLGADGISSFRIPIGTEGQTLISRAAQPSGIAWETAVDADTQIEVQDEAVSLTTAAVKLNFAGSGVTATEPIANEILVTIPGGASGNTTEVLGSTGIPQSIVAGTGITGLSTTDQEHLVFVEGSAGAVNITAIPQIVAGTTIGERLVLVGTSNINTLTLDDSDGLSQNGFMTLKNNSSIEYVWNGTVWNEISRRD